MFLPSLVCHSPCWLHPQPCCKRASTALGAIINHRDSWREKRACLFLWLCPRSGLTCSRISRTSTGSCTYHCPNYWLWKRINLDQPHPPLEMLGREGWSASPFLTMGGEDKYENNTGVLLRRRGGALVVGQVTHSVHITGTSLCAPVLLNDLP